MLLLRLTLPGRKVTGLGWGGTQKGYQKVCTHGETFSKLELMFSRTAEISFLCCESLAKIQRCADISFPRIEDFWQFLFFSTYRSQPVRQSMKTFCMETGVQACENAMSDRIFQFPRNPISKETLFPKFTSCPKLTQG